MRQTIFAGSKTKFGKIWKKIMKKLQKILDKLQKYNFMNLTPDI